MTDDDDLGQPAGGHPAGAGFMPEREALPEEPYVLRIPTLASGVDYDVDVVMRHAAFELLRRFLDEEYPGHVVWEPAEVAEMTELRRWWEAHWNMAPVGPAADEEVLRMHHRLVAISARLWV